MKATKVIDGINRNSEQIEVDLMRHITEKSLKFRIWIGILILVILVGTFAYYRQLRFGLIVTAMRDYTSWGIYISNFVFLVAVSLVGSLVSSILKLSKAEWATPLTRISEIIAVASIICASVIIIIDIYAITSSFQIIVSNI